MESEMAMTSTLGTQLQMMLPANPTVTRGSAVPVVFIVLFYVFRIWYQERRERIFREKYPHVVRLEATAKPKKKKTWSQWARKKATQAPQFFTTVYHSILIPAAQLVVNACHKVLIQPSMFLVTSLYAMARAFLTFLFRKIPAVWIACWSFSRQVYLRTTNFIFPPAKQEKLMSVLRKPKAERLQEAEKTNKSLKTNFARFDMHSTGQVRTQQYYYNPESEPGDRVRAEPSTTPPRNNKKTPEPEVIDDPDEIARRLSERAKIKQRIQTPPPKSRQRKRLPGMMSGKENGGVGANFQAPINAVLPEAQPKISKPTPVLTPKDMNPATPMNIGAQNSLITPRDATIADGKDGDKGRTHRPFLFSASTKEPLSAQIRKRRSAGETIFPHTPHELSKSLESQSGQKQPKRRRLLTVLPNTRKRTQIPPTRNLANKRAREEAILKEFNRKIEKEPEKPAPAPVTTPSLGSSTATSATFSFGGSAAGTPAPNAASTAATPAADSKPSIAFGAAAPATTPGASATPNIATDGKPGFTFSADNNKDAAASSDTNIPPFPAPGATPAPGASTAPTSAADAKPLFGGAPAAPPATSQPTAPDSTAIPTFGGIPAAAAAAPAAQAPAPNAQAGNLFGSTPATGAGPAASTSTFNFNAPPGPGSSGSGFSFNAGSAASTVSSNAPSAASSASDGTKQFQFGEKQDGTTNAAPVQEFNFGGIAGTSTAPAVNAPPAGTTFQFGNNNTPAPTQGGIGFGSGTTPAPATTAGMFGSAAPAAKPDPPATNSNEGPKPAFGSTASNTPQPGSTANPQAAFDQNSNASTVPTFGQGNPATPAATFGQNNNATPTFGQSTPAAPFGQNYTTPAATGFGVSNNAGATPAAPSFGQNNNVTPGAPGFGQNNSGAGATPFQFGSGGSTPGFGQATQTPQFGAPAAGFQTTPATTGGFQASQFGTPAGGTAPGFQTTPAGGAGFSLGGASARRRSQKNRKKRL